MPLQAIAPGGSFAFASLPVAHFRPQITGADGYFITDMSAEGAALQNGVLDILEGASVKLNVVASVKTGHVKGFVVKDEKPVPGLIAVLAPHQPFRQPVRLSRLPDGSPSILHCRETHSRRGVWDSF